MLNAPIAVFDSGIGGLTVLHALRAQFPQESFVYLGDTARLPYGTKSPETVAQYAVQMTEVLMTYAPKAIIIACNTASAAGLDAVKKIANHTPVIGMIEPATEQALAVTRNGHIAVLGTHVTVKSDAYGRALRAIKPDIRLTSLPCQLLVALAEEGWTNHPATRDILETYLAPIMVGPGRPDTVILGCTHFPVFLETLRELLPQTTFIHCGNAAAKAIAPFIQAYPATTTPRISLMVTDGADGFTRMVTRFFGTDARIGPVQTVDAMARAA